MMQRDMFGAAMPPIHDNGWAVPRDFPRLDQAERIAVDVETFDPNIRQAGPGDRRGDGHLVGIAVAVDGGRWYFPMRHESGANLGPAAVLAWARDALGGPQPKIGANLLYDAGWLEAEGVKLGGDLIDVQGLAALLDEHRKTYALDALGQDWLGEGKDHGMYEWQARAFGGKADGSQRANIYRTPAAVVGPYAEQDAALALRLYDRLSREIVAEGLSGVADLEVGVLRVVHEMRMQGAPIDVPALDRLEEHFAQRRAALCDGWDIWAADSIARRFEREGVEYPRTAKGKPSFTARWLETCGHPLAARLREARKIDKLLGTTLGGIRSALVNGRVHTTFNPLRKDDSGTVSGRFSSNGPNLQNIPARDPEIGPLCRALFVGLDGRGVRKFDYSQIEYRLLAHYAVGEGADEARAAYEADPRTDFHEWTQALIKRVTGRDLGRKPVKNINFGLCIAAGQRVLTHVGLVPIESVQDWHLLWDGVEWVRHGGVVFNGQKEVMTHDGLTATPDHEVWISDGRQVPLWVAASTMARLARSGDGDRALGFGDAQCGPSDNPEKRKAQEDISDMQEMRQGSEPICGQHLGREDAQLLMSTVREIQFASRANVGSALRRHGAALPKMDARLLDGLQGPWDTGPFQQQGALYTVGFGDVPEDGLQGLGLRQNRQRRPLQPWESATCDTQREPAKQTAEVYDILNAGPRNRFTVEGRLVHNCYGMGESLLCSTLGVTREEGAELFAAYHGALPFVRATAQLATGRANERGFIRTLGGRRARFPLWEDRDGVEHRAPGPGRRRSRTHKALNALLQGSAADLMKHAMLALYRAGVPTPLLTVHDELVFDDAPGVDWAEAARIVGPAMREALGIRVPILSDWGAGPHWGAC